MSLSRALFFLSLLLTLLAQGPVCCDGATTATNSFYFSFSSIYSYPAEQMYLTFFFICHSTISLSELSFRRVFFFSSLSHVCIHFKQFFVTCFIHARRSSSLSLSISSSNARDEKRMAAKRKTDRKLKDKAFENYSSVEKRM